MAEFDFDKATPEERNEAIALALGWKIYPPTDRKLRRSMPRRLWYWKSRPDAVPCNLPDWNGDDGLAFKELWTELSTLTDKITLQSLCLRLPSVEFYPRNSEVGVWPSVIEADTWTHAICKAFLALKDISREDIQRTKVV